MKKYERITDLPLEELTAMVTGKEFTLSCGEHLTLCGMGCGNNHALPMGAVANDIGAIFSQGNKEAEKVLATILADPSVAPIACFYLSQNRAELSPETVASLEQFENNPANQDYVRSIQARIAEMAEETI